MDIRIPIVVAVLLVGAVAFVFIIRANRSRDERGRAEAEARGEKVAPPRFNPTLVYLGIGVVFVIIGVFQVLKP